jgi:hypothetical protein
MVCYVCGRALKSKESVKLGIGPVCAKKQKRAAAGREDNSDVVDLPFDPAARDIVCSRRGVGRCHFNIYQVLVAHSPTGMRWGYNGSGPADFALNVLEVFLCGERDQIDVHMGSRTVRCSRLAFDLHHEFKADVIAGLPEWGGTIKGDDVRAWIEAHRPPPMFREGEPLGEGGN